MQMSQSIFGKGLGGGWLCSYAILPWYISVAVKRAIQLAWNKNCSIAFISKSKKKIEEEEEERKWMYHFLPPHNSFSVDPSTEMFTDSYHSPSFSHLCLDMFQKTGPFHLPSRCEEICSLMAFKTGSADNKKKRRSEKNASLPGHPPPTPPPSVDASFAELSAAAHCCSAKVPTVPVTLTSICRQLDTISSTAAYSHWMGLLSHSEVWMAFKAQAWNCVSSLCAIVFFVHSCCVTKKKSFITKLNTKTVVLEECTQEYITANVQIIPLSGKLETILKKKLFIYFKTSLYQWPSEE